MRTQTCLLLLALGSAPNLDAQAVTRFTGGIVAGRAWAPVRVEITDTALRMVPLAFSFLPPGASIDFLASRNGPRIDAASADGAHRLQVTVEGALMSGTYSNSYRSGTISLRETVRPDSALLTAASGLYRRRDSGRLWIRRVRTDALAVFDTRTGLRRIAYAVAPNRFVYGTTYDDPTNEAGTITLTARDGRVEVSWSGHDGVALTPASFREERITFTNGDVVLAGSMILPEGTGPFPLAVFAHGSGPATRNADRERALLFVERGVAALIFDKRGNGESTGQWQSASLEDFADDVIAAVQFARRLPLIRANRIGVHGVSQGGWVAPLAASRTSQIAFIITVSGPLTSADGQELYRRTLNLHGRGFIPAAALPDSVVALGTALLREFFDFVKKGGSREAINRRLATAQGQSWFARTELPDSIPEPLPEWLAGFRAQMQFDPAPVWRRLTIPALALFGDLDPFVPARESADALASIRRTSGPVVTIKLLPDSDHWLYQRTARLRSGPDLGYHPEYLRTLDEWLQQNVLDQTISR